MLTREEIISKLKDILISADARRASDLQNCTEDAKLLTDLGLTSVGMLYMVIAIEETFSIRFDNVGMSDFVTLGDVVNYVESRLK